MDNETRRRQIRNTLLAASQPVTAATLSHQLNVSRQTIVGDVALLRAKGEAIIPTARGYQYETTAAATMAVVVRHFPDDTTSELNLIVDAGGVVDNVEIEHPLYGLLKGELHIATRAEVLTFDRKRKELGGHLLSELTDGVHTHQISAPDRATLTAIKTALRTAGYLYE
ncbi:transcription repressor NadR [Secundilactobacillus kimchicus]|uniref:Transcription repressor NadR n=1 Tax=Secundilactobacillus kimchicus JCM 15530 TaxID=1302272 RepID=A0A0R1HPH0_9LACO|nr:transcription repressor NadR [Secundilactobacillus kimchicus]KRK47497.1 hypothetical protein FC96_GL002422 [Secundilactobacillus kimchicus JCM 15530]